MTPSRRHWYAAPILLLSVITPACGQTASPPQHVDVSAAPFDVASIRISHLNTGNQHVTSNNGTLTGENVALDVLIRFAYGLPRNLLAGGPSWLTETKFNIEAKTDAATHVDPAKLSVEERELFDAQKQVPLQKLLADRFQLKVHTEDRVMPMYALVPGKNGLKIKPSTDSSSLGEFAQMDMRTRVTGFAGIPGMRLVGRGKIVAIKTTLDQLAKYLTNGVFGEVDRPVVNKTGLTGRYDFILEWTPNSTPDDTSDAPGLFTAIQEQLGLKLEPQKGPVPVLVIDHVELPSEN